MGNDSSFLKKYSIQPEPFFLNKFWSIHRCMHSYKKMNLFVLNDSEHCFDVNSWKSIRHPFILKYYDQGLFQGKFCIVTEPVEPLAMYLDKLMTDEIIGGLSNICNALKFLHETCMLSHNFINLDSVFISNSNYSWKLGCLQFSTYFGSEKSESLDKLYKFLQNNAPKLLTPEDSSSGRIVPITKTVDIHRRDIYALGQLLDELFSGHSIKFSELLLSCKSPEFSKRPKISDILEDRLFTQCDYFKITAALTDFASLAEDKKKSFLNSLVDRMQLLPPELTAMKLAPLILTNRFLISHPSASVTILPYLFVCTPNERVKRPIFDERLFKAFVMPVILKLFCVRNIQVRLMLLDYLPYYVCFIDSDQLKSILPLVLLGMKDENDNLVAATFSGLSHLVATFGAQRILGERSKLFTSVTPKLNVFCSHESTSSVRLEPESVEALRDTLCDPSCTTEESKSIPVSHNKAEETHEDDISSDSSSRVFIENEPKVINISAPSNGGSDVLKLTLSKSSNKEVNDTRINFVNGNSVHDNTCTSSAGVTGTSSSGDSSSGSNSSGNAGNSRNSNPSGSGNNAKHDITDIRSIDFKLPNTDENLDLFSGMEPDCKFNINYIPNKNSRSKFDMLQVDEIENGWNEEAWDEEG